MSNDLVRFTVHTGALEPCPGKPIHRDVVLAEVYDRDIRALKGAVRRWWKEARVQKRCWHYVNDLAHSRLSTIVEQTATITRLQALLGELHGQIAHTCATDATDGLCVGCAYDNAITVTLSETGGAQEEAG